MSSVINLSSEGIFHTVQGEGKFVGYPSVFVRLSGCNLRCEWTNRDGTVTQCDTPHTSFNPEQNKVLTLDVIDRILEINCKKVVVTGGEPYFQRGVVDLIDALHDLGRHVTVETNGTIYRASKADFASISLKLASSGNGDRTRVNTEALVKFINETPDFQFKFVLNDDEDVTEIQGIIRDLMTLTGKDLTDKVWVMPQGIRVEQLDSKMLWLVSLCKQYGWNLSDRLHIRVWGHMKGV